MNNDGMFKNAFDKFIYLRATEVAITDLKHDPEYIALSNKEDEILRKIMELLPEEHRHLVFEREELSSDSTNLCIDQAYKYGLIPKFNPLNLVFCSETGEPMNPDFITRSFKTDQSKADDLPDIRFHDLRHGHATMLLELGEDLKVISERLGHSSITMTGDIYTHVREKMQREASDKLDQVIRIK